MPRLPTLRAPSLPTAISLLALAVAFGGSAVAASTTLVSLVDRTNPGRAAGVTTTHALRTAVVNRVIVSPPLNNVRYVGSIGTTRTSLTTVSSGTVAFTRIGVSNFGPPGMAHAAHVQVSVAFNTGSTCDASAGSLVVGIYEVPPNQTVIDPLPSPAVARPRTGAATWCLVGSVTFGDDPGSFYLPQVFASGYVAGGTPPVVDAVRGAGLSPERGP